MSEFRAGFASLLGRPNAGKSTLLNALIGTKLAAVSALPQTTRERFLGIYSNDDLQIVFVDLPGLVEADDLLNEALRENVLGGLENVDVVIHLVDVTDKNPLSEDIREIVAKVRTPMILAVNKLDGKYRDKEAQRWADDNMPRKMKEKYTAILGISAREKRGLGELLTAVLGHLPEGPPLYDPDDLTDRDLRFLSQEMIREKVFQFLHQELPYSCAVQIEDFKEREHGKWYIAATIYVERESQKGMVVGKRGAMLKQISTAARKELEELCQAPVYLELWIKVREKWRKKEGALRDFGYRQKKK